MAQPRGVRCTSRSATPTLLQLKLFQWGVPDPFRRPTQVVGSRRLLGGMNASAPAADTAVQSPPNPNGHTTISSQDSSVSYLGQSAAPLPSGAPALGVSYDLPAPVRQLRAVRPIAPLASPVDSGEVRIRIESNCLNCRDLTALQVVEPLSAITRSVIPCPFHAWLRSRGRPAGELPSQPPLPAHGQSRQLAYHRTLQERIAQVVRTGVAGSEEEQLTAGGHQPRPHAP